MGFLSDKPPAIERTCRDVDVAEFARRAAVAGWEPKSIRLAAMSPHTNVYFGVGKEKLRIVPLTDGRLESKPLK